MVRMNLAIPLILLFISCSIIGAEIMAPILTEGRLQRILPDLPRLGFWWISVCSLAVFFYNLGKRDAAIT